MERKYRKDKERNLFVVYIYGTDNRAVNRFILRGAGYDYKMASGAQGNGFGLLIYYWIKYLGLRLHKKDCVWNREHFMEILSLSGFTCLQQSVMNFGILMVQGLVNSFGAVVMAAFAVAVKIDTIAYMPVQDFGNAFSVFVAQNFSAGKKERIRAGMKSAGISVAVFCAVISTAVCFCKNAYADICKRQ